MHWLASVCLVTCLSTAACSGPEIGTPSQEGSAIVGPPDSGLGKGDAGLEASVRRVPGSVTTPAVSCDARCAKSIGPVCGSTPGFCEDLCASITEATLACLEAMTTCDKGTFLACGGGGNDAGGGGVPWSGGGKGK